MSAIVDAGEDAAEAVRQLNCLTLPADGAPGLEYPVDVYGVIADLKVMAQRLPQLLGQLSVWLGGQHAAGQIGHDSGSGAAETVASVRYWLDVAAEGAVNLESALRQAHRESSHLTGIDGSGSERHRKREDA